MSYNALIEEVKSVKDANLILIKHYRTMLLALNQSGKISKELAMCYALLENPDWPIDKVSRWVGYIQRGLIYKEITTVEYEREFSRGLFHAAYKAEGIPIPDSITV